MKKIEVFKDFYIIKFKGINKVLKKFIKFQEIIKKARKFIKI